MNLNNETSDIRVEEYLPLISAYQVMTDLPKTVGGSEVVKTSRQDIETILSSKDNRMLFIVGPCSISDSESALEYAARLSELSSEVNDKIVLVMRTYFEKPRTTVGWKGLINDPDFNGTNDINKGLHISRSILLKILDYGVACATEYLEPFTPQYNSDLISWAAIGARTVESPQHRQLASGLSMPVGFKNGTSGQIGVAINAALAARLPHTFSGITKYGTAASIKTKGNPFTHVILRGGLEPNYSSSNIKKTLKLLQKAGLYGAIMVDCSHGNSQKDYKKQIIVFEDVLKQRVNGNKGIIGVMIESNIYEGSQNIPNDLTNFDKSTLEYGVSCTDGCLGWDDTKSLIKDAYKTLR